MTNNFCALCADLIEAVLSDDSHIDCTEIARRARAALPGEPAVPESREPAAVTGQPSDEEIMGLMPQQMHEDLAYAARAMANEAGTDNRKAKGFMRIALNRHAVDLARAVLARWGNPTPQLPADGEVAELVEWLKENAEDERQMSGGDNPASLKLDRAAELLQRQALVPVSVSERPWEREGWCDVEGRFWAEHISRSGVASWRCAAASDLGGWAVRCLPAHALPLPEVGED